MKSCKDILARLYLHRCDITVHFCLRKTTFLNTQQSSYHRQCWIKASTTSASKGNSEQEKMHIIKLIWRWPLFLHRTALIDFSSASLQFLSDNILNITLTKMIIFSGYFILMQTNIIFVWVGLWTGIIL